MWAPRFGLLRVFLPLLWLVILGRAADPRIQRQKEKEREAKKAAKENRVGRLR